MLSDSTLGEFPPPPSIACPAAFPLEPPQRLYPIPCCGACPATPARGALCRATPCCGPLGRAGAARRGRRQARGEGWPTAGALGRARPEGRRKVL